ncbi:MAG TPA: hypothetical protein VL137_04140 [Polyangiaceae bacterium]|nr:hypothetical protein [Polyangiaceae bacterium]
MSGCLYCGAALKPDQAVCHACGKPVVRPQPREMQRTMLGIAQPGLKPAATAPTAAQHTVKATPNSPNLHKEPAKRMGQLQPASGKQTLLGMSVPNLGSAAQPAPVASRPAPRAAGPGGTMLGIPLSPNAAPPPAANPSAASASARPAGQASSNRGVAPLNPALQVPPLVNADLAPGIVSDEPLEEEDSEPWSIPTSALVVVGICSVLALGAIGYSIYYNTPKPVSASLQVDDDGDQSLQITCDGCEDGTKVALNGQSAAMHGGAAEIPLPEALPLGKNTLNLSVLRPGRSREDVAHLVVPVLFHIRADFSTLNSDDPELAVRIQAPPKATVTVDDDQVDLDENGDGRFAIGIDGKLQGQDSTVRYLNELVPYTVSAPNAVTQNGQLRLRVGIAPLTISAPGMTAVTDGDHFTLAGATAKGGSVSVDDASLKVDADGHFEQVMNVDSIGETSIVVRAQAPDLAPRSVSITVKRVADLSKEGDLFRQTATDQYGAYAQNVQKKLGMAVVADGTVAQSKVENHATRILLNVQSGCLKGPCVASVLSGSEIKLAPRAAISVFGHISGEADDASGSKVPEISAEFVLPAAPDAAKAAPPAGRKK